MMFEARRPSTPGRRTAALAFTPLLLALALLVGAKPAAAQEPGWPDVNVYHSPNDDGGDPRSETCPPGCLCDGNGPGTTVTINFDNLDGYEQVTSQYPPATFSGDGTVILAYPNAGAYGSSEPNWIQPMMDCDLCSEDVFVDFSSPVGNLSFTAVPTDNDYGGANVDVFQGETLIATENVSVDYGDTTVDLTAYSDVTQIVIRGVYNRLAYDNFSFDTGGGGQTCLINGGANEEAHIWIDGGLNLGAGETCKLPPTGNTGDYLCGADILLEITRGTGKLTHFRPATDMIDILVHHPVCQGTPGDDGFCPLPADTKRIRMNFRRGAGTLPLGPRKVADLLIDSTGSTEAAPTTLVVSGVEAASANLQTRPIAASGPEVIAEGPVGAQEPCVLQCDFNGDGGVGLLDFNVLASSWGTTGPSCTPPGPNAAHPGDCNCDGGVGLTDFNQLNAEWGQECPAE